RRRGTRRGRAPRRAPTRHHEARRAGRRRRSRPSPRPAPRRRPRPLPPHGEVASTSSTGSSCGSHPARTTPPSADAVALPPAQGTPGAAGASAARTRRDRVRDRPSPSGGPCAPPAVFGCAFGPQRSATDGRCGGVVARRVYLGDVRGGTPMARWLTRAGGRLSARLLVTLTAILLLPACAQPTPLPPIVVTVDPVVQPTQPSLPGFEDGQPRPLAAVTGDDGVPADFVADEVWLATDDDAALHVFLARLNGSLLRTFDPTAAGLTGLAKQHLVRIDMAAVPADQADGLADDLRALDANATGDHKVSSQLGLDLLAIASEEAAAGAPIGINWVGAGGGQFTDRPSPEAPVDHH